MKQHQSSAGQSDEYLTPRDVLDRLGKFDLDPCASVIRPWDIAKKNMTEGGLTGKWEGRVFCNPPFNRGIRPKFMLKMLKHGNGIMLIPAATETVAFIQCVWTAKCSVLFLYSRLHYCDVNGNQYPMNCGSAMCLVSYGEENSSFLKESGLGYTVDVHV